MVMGIGRMRMGDGDRMGVGMMGMEMGRMGMLG